MTLIQVSEEEFSRLKQTVFKDAIAVTDEEVTKIKILLGIDIEEDLRPQDFLMEYAGKCECCTRRITCYDVILEGEKVHGVKFLKRAMFGTKKIRKNLPNWEQRIVCSQCGNFWQSPEKYSACGYACV